MKYYVEKSLNDFEFWSGAADTIEELTSYEIDKIETMLEEDNCEMSETDINDFFWFERDTIAGWLGYSDFEELIERNK